jgi:pimeloyl-ACP methyl ester carboxylesterase
VLAQGALETLARALLIHGLTASKSAMAYLGSELARGGIDCYLIDLPGHGESVERFSWDACQRSVHEALSYIGRISAQSSSSNKQSVSVPMVLVGHSMGASLAIQTAWFDSSVAGVIAISPVAAVVDRQVPKQFLILLGEFDLPLVRRGAGFLFEQASGMSLPPLDHPGTWQSPDHSRTLVVLPWTEHTLGIFRPQSLLEICCWLKQFCPQTYFDVRMSRIRILTRILLCISLLLLAIPTFNGVYNLLLKLAAYGNKPNWRWLVTTIGFKSGFRPSASGRVPLHFCRSFIRKCYASINHSAEPYRFTNTSFLWVYGLASILAVLVLLLWNPWDRLRLMGGGYLSGFLCMTGVLAFAYRRFGTDELAISPIDLIAVMVFVSLFVLMAPLFFGHLIQISESPARLWRFPIIAVSLFPFHLFDEWVCRCAILPWHKIRLVLFHLSSRLLLSLVLLIGFFVLQSKQFLIVLVLPGMFILSSLCWVYAGVIYRRTTSIMASAVFSALSSAWFLSTFFVQL